MEYFALEWFDEIINLRVQYVYSISKKGYFYLTVNTSDGVTHCKNKRISEKEFISAFETYKNV